MMEDFRRRLCCVSPARPFRAEETRGPRVCGIREISAGPFLREMMLLKAKLTRCSCSSSAQESFCGCRWCSSGVSAARLARLSELPVFVFRLWGCSSGTNTISTSLWPTSQTSRRFQTSGPWRTRFCSNRPSAFTGRVSTVSSRW